MKRGSLLFLVLFFLLLLLSCGGPEKKPGLSDAQLLQQAEEALSAKKYEKAVTLLKQLMSEYPDSEWVPRAQLDLGKAYHEDEKYIEAKAEFQKFLDLHPKHELTEEARYHLGLTYFAEIESIDRDQTPAQRALVEFQTVLKEAPDSRYAEEAKEKIKICREKLAGYEFFVGRFYFRKGSYPAAVGRFRYLMSHYPATPVEEETLYYLGESLYRLEEPEDAARVFLLLLERYPNSEYRGDARGRLAAIQGY